MRLLLIGDDKKAALRTKGALKECCSADLAQTAADGEAFAETTPYNGIVIDLDSQGNDSIILCEILRSKGITIPIVILSDNGHTDAKINALNRGADDYITKPFSFLELEARLRAILRRHPHMDQCILKVGDLSLDVAGRVVKRGDTIIKLRRKEMAILEYLMRNEKTVVSRDSILDNIWGDALDSFHNTVDVHMKYLRDQVDKNYNKKLIKTVYGIGYKIES